MHGSLFGLIPQGALPRDEQKQSFLSKSLSRPPLQAAIWFTRVQHTSYRIQKPGFEKGNPEEYWLNTFISSWQQRSSQGSELGVFSARMLGFALLPVFNLPMQSSKQFIYMLLTWRNCNCHDKLEYRFSLKQRMLFKICLAFKSLFYFSFVLWWMRVSLDHLMLVAQC